LAADNGVALGTVGSPWDGGGMDVAAQFEALQKRVTEASSASRDELKERIDKVHADKDARQQTGEAAGSAGGKWAQMKAEVAARMDALKTKIDNRGGQPDARAAEADADQAAAEAAHAIDYASWTVENARLAALDAIDARVFSDGLAR
jgi:hypothetical protein